MNTLVPCSIGYRSLLVSALAFVLLSSSAPALVMRENGPEPVIVQIKESVRLSDQLDDRLDELASTYTQDGLQIVQRWAGSKFLFMLTFPSNFTRQKAVNAITRLERLEGVEKVVPVSAYNLHFRSGDFKRSYDPDQAPPDVARRGLDADRIGAPEAAVPEQAALALDRTFPIGSLLDGKRSTFGTRKQRVLTG
jgi:hypothetical protein